MPLLAVPNVSEGRDAARIKGLAHAFASGAALLDAHSDADHGRSVFTIAGDRRGLLSGLGAGAAASIGAVEMPAYSGDHPAIGALDVCPIVWVAQEDREEARSAALAAAETIGDLGVPVFLYGELASEPARIERAHFRRGGLTELAARMAAGELAPDFGPSLPHPTAGATLVTARPPLAAFNVELDSDDVALAAAVAAALREAGGGLPGVRAIGMLLSSGRAQVSTNVHDPVSTSLASVVERVRELAALEGARPVAAELVGLVPAAALIDYPADVPIHDFDPARQTIEGRLAALEALGRSGGAQEGS